MKLTRIISRLTTVQVLGEPKQQASDFLSFLYQNVGLVLMIVFGCLLTRLVAVSFLKTIYSSQTRRVKWFSVEILLLACSQTTRQLPKLAILFLFFILFSGFKFILVTILCNLIKTDKVVIDTSFLIDEVEKLGSTDKKPIFVEHELDFKLISEAPKDSELDRMFNRILKQKDGFFLLRRRSFGDFFLCLDYLGSQNYFFFTNRLLLVYVLNIVTSFFERVFFNHKSFYETAR